MTSRVKKVALIVFFNGLLTLITVAAIPMIAGGMPKPYTHPNKAGFNTAIIWMELVQDAEEVFLVLGPSNNKKGRDLRTMLDRTNYADFAFMVAYSLLNASIFILLHFLNIARKRRLFGAAALVNAGLAFAALMLVGDILENVQLLALTEAKNTADVSSSTLLLLNVFTRVKWGAILVSSLIFGLSYAAYFSFKPGLLLGMLYSVTAFLGIFAITFTSARPLLEIVSNLLALAWFFSFVHACILLVRYKETE